MRRSWWMGVWMLAGLIGRSAEVEAGADEGSADEPALVLIERNGQTEYFALRTDSVAEVDSNDAPAEPQGKPGTSTRAIGACALTRSHADGSWAFQLDIELPLEETRVLQVETSSSSGRDCIWRELRAGSGRTIRFGVQPEGTEATEWASGGTKRKSAWPDQRGLGLLELIQLARQEHTGRIPSKARWIDPLAAELVPVVILVEDRGSVRTVDVYTSSGDRVAHVAFEGHELTALGWQAGGLIAERVSAEAHARLIADRRRSAARSAARSARTE